MSATSIVVPTHALPASLTHEATRRRLTGPGLPADHGMMRFGPLAASRFVPVSALIAEGADPGGLDPRIADLLLIGHLRCEEDDAQELVLDGTTGRVFSMTLFEDAPHLIDVIPLAPSVDALARLLSHVDDFRLMSGRFSVLAGRTGVDVVAEASALLLSAFTAEDWSGEGRGGACPPSAGKHALPALWRIAATVHPLALVAGRGSGLRLELPAGLLDEEFGPDEMVRVDTSALPDALVHEPTRRFLTEVGLPKVQRMFGLWQDDYLLRTLAESESPTAEDSGPVPAGAENLVCLGSLVHDFEVVIDGRTGLLSYRLYDADTTTPVNADVSTLAFTMWMFNREGRLDEEHDFTGDFYHQLADAMVEVLASVDPVACLPSTGEDDYRYWPEVFHDEAGGVLCP
ncbi:SUKH-4 family immunity protein [Streptomyces sp. NPDC058646]|uniref:SUKH-4 family immunity protein n=1 Tax=Streptomyces sp. NPDC058646 TaxID=3346574 RepID=UPI003646357E